MPTSNAEANPKAATLQINTRFGTQEIDPASVIDFPSGLPGFEDCRTFTLLHEDGKQSIFYLQSVDDPEVQLPVLNPDACQVSYQCLLDDDEAAILQIEDPDDVAILVTVANGGVKDNGIHANFMGPIILNTRKRIGLQKRLSGAQGSVVIRAE